MILFFIYALALIILVYQNKFFGLFKDEVIQRKTLALLLTGKVVAVPIFYVVYTKLYGGIEKFDTGKFFHDVVTICDFAKKDPGFFFRLLFGLQNDNPGSYDYVNCLHKTVNWDNGTVKDYLYNDNRVVIRFHAILHFLSMGSYQVHALFNCFLSFIGIFFLYRSLKEYFAGKELAVLLVLCFFPALWFYTGALLKEGICLFVFGCMLYQLKKLFKKVFEWPSLFFLGFLFFISCLLKPYLLLFAAVSFGLFFGIQRSPRTTYKPVFYFSTVLLMIFMANCISILSKNRSLAEAALQHQQRFEAVSTGGIFLTDSTNYMQLKPDTSLVVKSEKENFFRIKKGVRYMFWEENHPTDTLYATNYDTITSYRLIYYIPKSGSNVQLNKTNFPSLIASSAYYALLYPFFFNASSLLHVLASFENLLLAISMLISLTGIVSNRRSRFLPLCFLFFALSLCLLIGITAPNSGAIFRYRAPAAVFVILSALYYLDLFSTRRASVVADNKQ